MRAHRLAPLEDEPVCVSVSRVRRGDHPLSRTEPVQHLEHLRVLPADANRALRRGPPGLLEDVRPAPSGVLEEPSPDDRMIWPKKQKKCNHEEEGTTSEQDPNM